MYVERQTSAAYTTTSTGGSGPTAAEIAAELLSSLQSTTIPVNLTQVKGQSLVGVGTELSPWGLRECLGKAWGLAWGTVLGASCCGRGTNGIYGLFLNLTAQQTKPRYLTELMFVLLPISSKDKGTPFRPCSLCKVRLTQHGYS